MSWRGRVDTGQQGQKCLIGIYLIAEWPCACLGQINKKPQLCEGKESAVKLALGSLHLIIWKHKSGLEISELDSSVTRYNYNKQTLKENLRCSIISREKINHLCKLIQCTSGIRFICLLCLGSRDGFGAGEWIRGCKSPSCLKGKGGNAPGYGGKEGDWGQWDFFPQFSLGSIIFIFIFFWQIEVVKVNRNRNPGCQAWLVCRGLWLAASPSLFDPFLFRVFTGLLFGAVL